MLKTWTVGIFISLISASLAGGAASTNISFFKGIDADSLILNAQSLGTIANGGTATLVLATNVYRATFSGATATIALPAITVTTNDYLLLVKGTNTSGGSQIIAFPALIRDEFSSTVPITTITNNAGAAFRIRFESSGAAWLNVDASGDALMLGVGVKSYTITAASGSLASPLDSSTYLFGSNLGITPSTTADGRSRIPIPITGTVVKWSVKFWVSSTLGTTEDVTCDLLLNGATGFGTILVDWDAIHVQGISGTLSQTVTAGDYINVRFVTPAWATNPAAVFAYATIVIEY